MYTVEFIKEKTIPVVESYGIKSMSLLGSYARGEADDNINFEIVWETLTKDIPELEEALQKIII